MSARSTTYLLASAPKVFPTIDSYDPTLSAWETWLENCSAKLTEAAYPVMLRHGAVDNWLDLELELWKSLTDIVRSNKQEQPGSAVTAVGS
jgi:hypothetical protein